MSVLTRIKNNQITDSTILANTKIVPGSIVGSLFNANMVIASDFTITGNLTVQGSSSYLTVASTNTYVNDPLIVINNAFAGTNTYDLGIVFNRGSSQNQALIWSESADEFRMVATNETGTTYGNVVPASYANLTVGNLRILGAADIGSVTLNDSVLNGNIAVNGGFLTTTATTFNLINANVATVNFAGSATTVTIGATTGTANLRAANIYFPNATTFYDGQATVSFMDTNVTTLTAWNAATTLTLGATSGTANIRNANVYFPNASTIFSGQATVSLMNTVTTAVNAFGSATQITIGATTGTANIRNANIYLPNATTIYGGQATVSLLPATTTLTVGNSTGTANILYPNIYLPNTTSIYTGQTLLDLANVPTAVNAFNGATQLTLGATTGTANIRNANVYFPNATTIYGGQATLAVFNVTDTVTAFTGAESLTLGSTTGATTIQSGNLWLPNASNIASAQTTVAVFNTNSTTVNAFGAATALTLGATSGNATIRNSITNIAGTANVQGTGTSTTPYTGALQVMGGVGVAGNINLAGDYLGTSQATFNLLNDTVTVLRLAGSASNITIGDTAGTIAIRNANIYLPNASTLFSGQTSLTFANTVTTTLNIGGATTALTLGGANGVTNLLGNASVRQSTPSTNTTTGALIVAGGAGIGGNLNVGGQIGITGVTVLTNTTESTSTTTGALQVGGGAGVVGNVNIGGNLNVTRNVIITGNLTVNGDVTTVNTATLDVEDLNITVAKGAASSAAANGAGLTVDGAAASIIYTDSTTSWDLNKATRITVTTDSTNNATGALQVLGGAGIAESLYARDINNTVIGNVTAASGRFTTLTSTSTTNLSLTTATAINSTPIGNATPSTGAFTTLTSNGITTVTNSTSATSVGTGAFQVTGGASVGGNLYVGGNINIVGSSFVLTGNSGVFYGDVNGFNALYAGVIGYTALPQTVLQTSANFNGYVQNNFENINTGAKASTDWVATAGDGGDTNHYINMGITTVNWDGTQDNSLTNAIGPNDGYLYVQGNIAGAGGNLTIGSSTNGTKQVRIIVGGNTASNVSSIFRNPNTTSTSTTTGALTVWGGIGLTGNLWVGGPDVSTNASTLNVFNATATTVNAFGAATTFTLGGTSGTASLRNANIWLPNATSIDGASATVGVFNNATTVNAFDSATAANIGAGSGTITINNPTLVGQQPTQNLYNTVATTMNFAGAATTVTIGATSGTANIRNANIYLPNATTIYSGQTSLTFANTVTTTVNAFGSATALNFASTDSTTIFRGNLKVEDIIYANSGINSTNSTSGAVVITGGLGVSANVHIAGVANVSGMYVTQTAISTSSDSGVLIVAGGVGLGANLNVHGGTVINIDQTLEPFQVKGKYATTLIYADSVNDTVTIGGSNLTPISGAPLRVEGTSAMIIPVGTTSQRPGSQGNVDIKGMIRLNSSLNIFEYYDGTAWQSSQGSFTVISSEQFNGNGVANVYTMSSSSTTAGAIISINGIVQIPTTSYSISGTTLTFTEAPETGDVIDVRRLTTSATVTSIVDAQSVVEVSTYFANISTGTGGISTLRLSIDSTGLATFANDVVISGNLTVAGFSTFNGGSGGTITIGDADIDNVVIGADVNSNIIPSTNLAFDLGSSIQAWNKIYVSRTIHDQTATNIPSTSAVLVDQFPTGSYTTAKYIVQVKQGTTANIQAMEALVVHDSTNAYITTYGIITTGNAMGVLTANIVSSNVRLYYTSSSITNSNVKVTATYVV